jgi:protocatechuate 3,4-dioxygenase beta subunit
VIQRRDRPAKIGSRVDLDAGNWKDVEVGMKKRTIARRQVFAALGATTAAIIVGCGKSDVTSPSAVGGATTSGTTGSTNAACAVTPTETVGPFPSLSDMLRSDIREGKPGTPLMLTVRVVSATNGCGAVAGASVEIWQCDAAGNYSQYGSQAAATYLRGIQVTSASGEATFTTIYPGWYQGRATHIHVEVKVNGQVAKVTQMAFPESVSATVYASGVYASRGTNPLDNARDMVFSDSLATELVTPAGDPASGYSATFQVGI